MRLVIVIAALALAACAHKKEAGPAPLPAHPVGEVSSGALPPPAELSAPAAAPSSQDNRSTETGAGQ
jgi:hypothetical protein